MKYEIERKFLVKKDLWEKVEKPNAEIYRQGYISTEPERTVRVRAAEGKAFLTIKGISKGARRLEYEYEIPFADANELLYQFAVSSVDKIRYKVNFGGKVWEVDEYLYNNSGLITAEIELESEDEEFEMPKWVGEEVTDDARYFNSNLSVNPFNKW